MRYPIAVAVCGVLCAILASDAPAGEWTISGTFGHPIGVARPAPHPGLPGHHPGFPTHYSWGPSRHYSGRGYYPGYSSWFGYHDGRWNVGFRGGYPVGGWWDRTWGSPIYVVQPWPVYGSITVIGGGVYPSADDDTPPAPRGDGVFMVAVSAPPKADAERLDGIRAPLPAPATAAAPADSPAPPDRARRSLEPAQRLFRLGGVDRAETELGKLLRANPSDAEVSLNYAWVLFLREKYAVAGWCLRRAMVLDAKLVATGAVAVSGFHDAKSSAEALTRLDRYLESQPKDASARLVRAWALYVAGRLDDARAECGRVLEAAGDDPQAAALRDLCAPAAPAQPAPEKP